MLILIILWLGLIKKLLSEDNLEYITDFLRNLLKISKPNNPNCFKKNGILLLRPV